MAVKERVVPALEKIFIKKYFSYENTGSRLWQRWLSHRLSSLPAVDITAIDINHIELQQAERVFGHFPNLRFVLASIESTQLEKFDHIVFAASIQYFSSLKEVIDSAMQKLKPGGEIHILDTHFYKPQEIAGAKYRTTVHYNELGCPEMPVFYFHHTLDDLNSFRYEILYQPSFLRRRFGNDKNPFPWICIKKT
jgi:ubiquinone/menaquinone biosynthesis C-methylase UbiE